MPNEDDYALKAKPVDTIAAPVLPYQPPRPRERHAIALVGAGGISFAHLDAYRKAGFEVSAICEIDRAKAESRRDQFFPEARVIADYREVLDDPDIEIMDLTPHVEHRQEMIRNCLTAGKHVLTQKPFVIDLDVGTRLCDLADECNVRLAVNQNGRWAPHFAYIREAVRQGLLGDVASIRIALAWDHRWIRGTPFEAMRDVVLYDFGIHWFDFVSSIMKRAPATVTSVTTAAPWTGLRPPMQATTVLDYGDAQASLSFDAANAFGPTDTTFVGGTRASIVARGPDLGTQRVELWTAGGVGRPELTGQWFNDGFAGTMGELMCAIEDGRAPLNNARDNLDSLALCFAAVASARSGAPVVPGTVRRLPEQTV